MDDLAAGRNAFFSPPQRLRIGQLLRLSALWFGLQFFWTSQQIRILHERVDAFAPPEHVGMYYGWIKAAGAIVVLLTQLSIGFLSDHAWSKLGPRRPFMIAGLASGLVAIVGFMFAPDYGWLFAAYVVLELALNTTSVSFQSLLPDLVPLHQHALAGSFMGLLELSGTLFGFFSMIALTLLFSHNPQHGYMVFLLPLYLLVVAALGLVNVLGVDENGWRQHARVKLAGAVQTLRILPGTVVRYAAGRGGVLAAMVRDYLAIDLRQQPNFIWLAASRFLIYCSYQTFATYVDYYVKHNLDGLAFLTSFGLSVESATKLLGLVLPLMMVFFILGGLGGSLAAGPLAVKRGKKWVIGAGILTTSAMSIPLIFAHSVWIAVAAGAVLGIGWGAFLASDWAFACSLMPKDKVGSYMGLWALTNLLPQVLAPVVAGAIRDAIYNARLAQLGEEGAWALANQWVFASMLLYFLGGLALLRKVREDPVAPATATSPSAG